MQKQNQFAYKLQLCFPQYPCIEPCWYLLKVTQHRVAEPQVDIFYTCYTYT